MKYLSLSAPVVLLALFCGPAAGQQKKSEADFVKEKPTIGDSLPDFIVYSPDGKEIKTSDLRGQHVVLTFGCLT